MRIGMILSIATLALGVLFFIGAVSGMLFARATPMTDIGLYSVTISLLALGGLGMWANKAEVQHRIEN